MPSHEVQVRGGSTRFHAALNRMASGDDGSMDAEWSLGQAVTTLHPISGRQVGWSQVRESFHPFSLAATDGHIRLEDQAVEVVGDLGCERRSLKLGGQPVPIDSRVTNSYRREAGDWKLVHHPSDLSPAMVAALDRLMAKAQAVK